MKINPVNDTICAISTPPGTGGFAVIRVSGPDTFALCNPVFRATEKGFTLLDAKSHTIHFGEIRREEDILDEVLVSIFRSPHSYTGEDVLEISCHGSTFIQQKLLELLISLGIRLAKPGEFTLRAFLNQKFDLSQ